MARRDPPASRPVPPTLVGPRQEAAEKIDAQIEKGKEFKIRQISSNEDLERIRAERSIWWLLFFYEIL